MGRNYVVAISMSDKYLCLPHCHDPCLASAPVRLHRLLLRTLLSYEPCRPSSALAVAHNSQAMHLPVGPQRTAFQLAIFDHVGKSYYYCRSVSPGGALIVRGGRPRRRRFSKAIKVGLLFYPVLPRSECNKTLQASFFSIKLYQFHDSDALGPSFVHMKSVSWCSTEHSFQLDVAC